MVLTEDKKEPMKSEAKIEALVDSALWNINVLGLTEDIQPMIVKLKWLYRVSKYKVQIS